MTAAGTECCETSLRSKVFFTANVPGLGRELWASDGTRNGTKLVRQFTAGEGSTFFREFARVGNQVYFTIQRANGFQMWRTNGLARGTRLVRNFPITAQPQNLVGLKGKVYFKSKTAALGSELWVSNGTGKGTRPLIDLNPGSASSNATPIRAYRGRVYIDAYAGAGRPTLWSTDGTRVGTRAVADLDPQQRVSDPDIVDSTIMGGRLYLWVEDRIREGSSPRRTDLWITNGTQAGTRLVANTNARDFLNRTARPQTVASKGWIFYQSDEAASGREWHTVKPGASGGRTNINPGSADASIAAATPVAYKGSVYVAATSAATGNELWRLSCPA